MKKAIITIILISCLGCAASYGDTSFVLGQSKVEFCKKVGKVGDTEFKEDCKTVESKGLSAEFVAFTSLAFGWIPWPF